MSLPRVLVLSLLVLSVLPVGVMAWLAVRSSAGAVQDRAGTALATVAAQVQAGVQTHAASAHHALNGLFPERPSPAQAEQARDWLRHGGAFESMAFALTRQTPAVPSLFFGNNRGEYFAVENTGGSTTVLFRNNADAWLQAFLARRAGDRSSALSVNRTTVEPRSRIWYQSAVAAKRRVFSPVQALPGKAQLFVTLAQPVYEADDALAGVFGVDLHLQQLSELLRAQSFSPNGAAFIVDEAGLLVAGSAGDALLQEVQGQQTRRSPPGSANRIIREAFAGLQLARSRKPEEPVIAGNTALQRLPLQGDTLLMVQRPVGESLGLRWTLVVAAPESDFTADAGRAWLRSLAPVGALLLFGVLAALYIGHRIGRGLKGLGKAVQQLGRGEIPRIDRHTRLKEIRHISQAIHDSAEQFKGERAEMLGKVKATQDAREYLEERVAKRTVELLASREDALQAVKAKAAFLATMSHEIRTPLNGVVGMSTLLAQTALDDEQRDYLKTLRQSGDQLLIVINDILDFSKIESGQLELQVQPLSLRRLIEEACDNAYIRAQEKNLELTVDISDAGSADPSAVPAAISADGSRLRQVLVHLVSNAIKFTDKGKVSVSVRQLPHSGEPSRVRLEFRVVDSGIGIPHDRLGNLFQAFTQLDASTTRKYGGTGLGLAICKRLVELMGGEIGVESNVGKGSTFWFVITVQRAHASSVVPAVDATASHRKYAPVVENQGTSVPTPRGQPSSQERLASSVTTAKNITLLVVDDNSVNLKVACAMLSKMGYQFETALDGREAVQAVARAHGAGWRFGAVLMDVNMPRMNGLQATQQIQTMMDKKAPPVLALTAASSPEDRARCIAAGMADYLTKPLRMSELAEALERWSPRMPSTATAITVSKASTVDFARTQVLGPAAAGVSAITAKVAPTGEPVLMDLDRLAQFKEFDDEQLSMTREVIGLFVADASQRLQAIERSIQGDDAIGLAWASHALIGATSNVGAVAMQTICSELETAAKTGAVPVNAKQQLEKLNAFWVKTKAVLDSWE
ncbi:MAG TPA: ATP-binding protein [Polaromonas sp.]|nr:ATP-binding protein [Polaromonas sp.]